MIADAGRHEFHIGLVAGTVLLAAFLGDRRMMRDALQDHSNPYIYSSRKR